MKKHVYMVEYEHYDDRAQLGPFSTRAAAEALHLLCEACDKHSGYQVVEYELDARAEDLLAGKKPWRVFLEARTGDVKYCELTIEAAAFTSEGQLVRGTVLGGVGTIAWARSREQAIRIANTRRKRWLWAHEEKKS